MTRHAVAGKMGRQEKTVPTTIIVLQWRESEAREPSEGWVE